MLQAHAPSADEAEAEGPSAFVIGYQLNVDVIWHVTRNEAWLHCNLIDSDGSQKARLSESSCRRVCISVESVLDWWSSPLQSQGWLRVSHGTGMGHSSTAGYWIPKKVAPSTALATARSRAPKPGRRGRGGARSSGRTSSRGGGRSIRGGRGGGRGRGGFAGRLKLQKEHTVEEAREPVREVEASVFIAVSPSSDLILETVAPPFVTLPSRDSSRRA